MNIIDYIKWRGDISFKIDSFNEVDNLCFSYISYCLVEPYFENINTVYTIKELSRLYFRDHTEEETKKSKSFIGMSPFVLKEMGESKRFGNCIVHHFKSILDISKIEQFCALQIDIDSKTTYLSFRGTDDTLLGWEEDFNMAYKVSSAQVSAVDYANKYININRKYYFGGHSKGGNLAIYAATYTKPLLQKKIINVYSNDGPGLLEEIIHSKKYLSIKDRIIKIVPDTSIIGMLFNDVDNYIVIKSNNSLIMQHDGLSWQVERNRFLYSELSNISKMIHLEINKIFNDNSKEDVNKFASYLFTILNELDITNIHDLSNVDMTDIKNALVNAKHIDKKSKELIRRVLRIFNKTITLDIEEKASKVIKNILK